MKERIQDIKQTLSLNKSDLSKQVRRKISAPDERMSSTLLGCVGVVFLVFSIGVIVIPDTMKLIKYMKGKLKTTN
ncbi:hypothetical protein FSP39_001624 [Pinctada imbricata]|uniref:Uncharacterized protein n=1 Tax=Pinctada imbricata TaxID=66713 RepID=A0AA89C4T0_PINIB|nr:hypothetical protein FSP39_001624 [Pinctada imbricata]